MLTKVRGKDTGFLVVQKLIKQHGQLALYRRQLDKISVNSQSKCSAMNLGGDVGIRYF
jgi:hypothetical protein